MNWYTKVSRNISLVPECIKHFDMEYQIAKKECSIWGNLEKAAASMPGIVEHRFNQLQEIEAILEYLNIEYKRLKSKTFRKYFESYNKLLSSREADKYVEGESDVIDLAKIINEFALLRNQWLGITKGLDQKQWQITNIVKLRVAGMEDASIR
jgi:hypothetical protein